MTPHEHFKAAELSLEQAKNPRKYFDSSNSFNNDFRELLLKIADRHMAMIEFAEKYDKNSTAE